MTGRLNTDDHCVRRLPLLAVAAARPPTASRAGRHRRRDVVRASRSNRPPVVGTAVISGTVTMAGGTQPARKVRVSLSGVELRGGRSATTDDSGPVFVYRAAAGATT